MKRIITAALSLSLLSMGLVGCSDTSSTKSETTVKTPTGSQTVTHTTEVKETGKPHADKTP